MRRLLSAASGLCLNASLVLTVFFTFIFPLKFGLPYLSNIILFRPTLDISDTGFFFSEWVHNLWANELAMMIIVAAFFLFMMGAALRKDFLFRVSWPDFLFILFLISAVPSVFFSKSLKHSLNYFLLFCSYYLYFFLLNQHMGDKRKRQVFYFAFFAAFLLVLLQGLYQYFVGIDETVEFIKKSSPQLLDNPDFESRILSKKMFSTFIYSNTFAGFLLLALPVMTAFIFSSDKRILSGFIMSLFFVLVFSYAYLYSLGRPDLVGYAFLWSALYPAGGVFALFKTRSEGAVISLAAAAGAAGTYFLLRYRRYSWALFSAVTLFLAAGALFLWTPAESKQRVERGLQASLGVRSQYYQAGLAMMKETSFFGSGPGTFGIRYSQFKLPEAEETQMAHNVFLQLAIETGPSSTVFLLLFFVFLIWMSIHKRSEKGSGRESLLWDVFLLTSLLSAIFHNTIDFDFFVPSYGFALMFVAAIIAGRSQKNPACQPAGAPSLLILKKASFVLAALIVTFTLMRYLGRSFLSSQHYRRSMEYFDQGLVPRSIDEMKEAMDIDPLNDMFYYDTARKLVSVRDFSGAEYFYCAAIKMSPEKPYYHYEYALAMFKNDQKSRVPLRGEEILGELKEAIRLYPTKELYRREMEKFERIIEGTSS
ncbi:MAG: O-antigen ligase family protein [Candidatus Aureabacteria bacterium]|nr:O-antigen ligase family protein [Candidatus Auribacterota bacterium]